MQTPAYSAWLAAACLRDTDLPTAFAKFEFDCNCFKRGIARINLGGKVE